ncbi:integrase [Legionella nautarum]|uniref:Integrase n=1 Tax=Legionella nautarum TaxID=45070 RepID=A0A0W0WW38_9GAMM|nr:site-specific integrase [Legionella nautarum]KTD36530.1 integrase [Legionella nautarum]
MGIFTDTYIKGLKPKANRYEEYEGGGFGIRVTPKGVKSWIYRYKIADKTDKITLGHYPTMSLANAKKRFLELSGLRQEKINPKERLEQQKKELQKRQSNTVEKLAEKWFKEYVTTQRKRPTVIRKQIDRDIIPLLGKLEIDAIQTLDISEALSKVVARGAPIHANRVLSSLKQLFNYAMSQGHMNHNPAAVIRPKNIGGQEHPRERYLSLEEIRTLWLFLDSPQNQMSLQTKSAIKLILLTGVRTAELRLAQWGEFNFEQSLWTIPAKHSKTGIVTKIHLSSQTKAILHELKENSTSPFVLSGADKQTPLTENALPRAIKRIQERVGVSDWTAHDLRRTFATQLGESLHVDPVVIEKCLGHKMPKIMATYNKNEMLLQRKEALNLWAQYIENLLKDNVVPLQIKRA